MYNVRYMYVYVLDHTDPSFQEELTLEGYKRHLESQKAEPPLTDAEQELKMLKESEVGSRSLVLM